MYWRLFNTYPRILPFTIWICRSTFAIWALWVSFAATTTTMPSRCGARLKASLLAEIDGQSMIE